ncbi:MAG: PilZ domain-containing protein [Planctomycetota bacterium]|jgi:hypothetical protein|nr:PilZ domain-containing protein [Planctomycetota bacterium]MDP7134290.1 PilZ domain-containing protein [Planctomycetota bacterium]MDP7254446.1 PilZ domain-containing protein [Planctomycetota bacterium]
MRDDWRKILSEMPLEELKKARLYIDLLLLRIQDGDPEIEKELGLLELEERQKDKTKPPGGQEGREHERHKVNYPCTYQVIGGPKDRQLDGAVLDISAGGCQIHLQRPLRVGEMIQIRMHVSGQGEKTVLGQIKWIRVDPTGDLSKWLAGIQFTFDHAVG